MKTSELIKETQAEVNGALEAAGKATEDLVSRIQSLQEEVRSLQEANLALRKSAIEFKNWAMDRLKSLSHEMDHGKDVEAYLAKGREIERRVYEGR